MEQAFGILARQLHLPLVDLVAGFQNAAGQGKLLYYPLDTHWNREGRYLAAKLVAAFLPSRIAKDAVQAGEGQDHSPDAKGGARNRPVAGDSLLPRPTGSD